MTVPAQLRAVATIGLVRVNGRPVSREMQRIITAAWGQPGPFRLHELLAKQAARCSAIHTAYRHKTRGRKP